MAALSAGVIGLIVAFPELAVSVGFALSVIATAGLVLLAEPLSRRLILYDRVATLPAPVVRAVAVAIVAHLATMPVLGILVGKVSNTSIAANLLAAPAVAPVTIAGSLAAFAAALSLPLLPQALAYVAAPFAWWIYQVAQVFSSLSAPAATPASIVASCLITALCFTTLWQWPRASTRIAAAATVASGLFLTVTAALGLDIPRATPDWDAAVCWEKDGPVFLRWDVGAITEQPEASAMPGLSGGARRSGGQGEPGLTDRAGRRCRTALGLDSAPAHSATASEARALVVESPSYIGQSATGDAGPSASGAGNVDVASGTEPRWIVALECGERIRQDVRTPAGIPVVCLGRDGPQALYADGSVWRGRHEEGTWQRRIYGTGAGVR